MVFYRGEEFEGLEKEITEITEANNKRTGVKYKEWNASVKRIFSSAFLKPFSCVGALFILFRLSGYSMVVHYTTSYLETAGAKMDPMLGTVLVGLFRLLAALCAPFALLRIPKKALFISSGLAGAVGMIASNHQLNAHVDKLMYTIHHCSNFQLWSIRS
jgi:hypothetical protein